jgi:hypothetical protein
LDIFTFFGISSEQQQPEKVMNPWTRYYFGISEYYFIQFKTPTKTEIIEKFHVGGYVIQDVFDDESKIIGMIDDWLSLHIVFILVLPFVFDIIQRSIGGIGEGSEKNESNSLQSIRIHCSSSWDLRSWSNAFKESKVFFLLVTLLAFYHSDSSNSIRLNISSNSHRLPLMHHRVKGMIILSYAARLPVFQLLIEK